MNENEKMVRKLAKLQFLYIRWMERHVFRNMFRSYGKANEVINPKIGNMVIEKYKDGVEHLRKLAERNCKNEDIVNAIKELEKDIKKSEIAELRFGLNNGTFTDKEVKLDNLLLRSQLFMNGNMVGIKYIVENFGLSESTVKQACQQERLLNTRKVGNNWMVHIPEVKAYWEIPDNDEDNLYYGWKY